MTRNPDSRINFSTVAMSASMSAAVARMAMLSVEMEDVANNVGDEQVAATTTREKRCRREEGNDDATNRMVRNIVYIDVASTVLCYDGNLEWRMVLLKG